MKSFWISLFIFILLMCSCRSKEVATNYSNRLQMDSDVSYMNETLASDTTKTAHSEQIHDNKVIIEKTIIEEYDKDTGTLTKKTETARTIAQGVEKVVNTEEIKGMSEANKDSLNHIRGVTKKIESESETVTDCNGFDDFGKWFGISLGLIIGLFLVYLLRKFRVN